MLADALVSAPRRCED